MSINKTVLIVEDDQLLQKILAKEFENYGFKTLLASNGIEGLERTLNENPDLILLDIIMPRMDGLTMLKKLRQDEKSKEIPVIVLTNLSDAEAIDESLKNGIYDFLVKANWELPDIVAKAKQKLRIV